jgi:methylglutaconyl-CoA hydratase
MDPYCTLNHTDGVATIEFGSPAHNALPSRILEQLSGHLDLIKQEPGIKIVLIQSQGDRSFCAGADLNELVNLQDELEGKKFFFQFARIILAMRSCPQLIITRVQGKAVGGALGLVAAADLAYATDQASVRLSELINGIGPFVVGPAIERKTGIAAFNHLALNPASWFPASWAMDHGLFNEVFHIPEAMDERISEKIDEFREYSHSALQEIKKMMWSGIPDWNEMLEKRAAISGRLIMTKESKDALSKLVNHGK